MSGRLTLVERFFDKVDRNGPLPEHYPDLGPCWLWTGATTSAGYGEMKVHGVVLLAHRLAYKLAHGRSAPIDREVAHHCDRPLCVKPSHLFVATHARNMADCAQKGRARNQHSKAAA